MNFYFLLKIWVEILVKTLQSKPLHHAKKSVTDALKTKFKKVIQKAAETTDDLIGNKIDKKIKKNSPQNNSETYS